MEVTRYVNLTYAVGFILAAITLNKATAAIWAGFERLPNVGLVGNTITLTDAIGVGLSAALIIYLYKREDYRQRVSEVMLELKKVTWPTWDETKRNTLVVIIFCIVLSAFLWGTDQFWKQLTDLILLPPET